MLFSFSDFQHHTKCVLSLTTLWISVIWIMMFLTTAFSCFLEYRFRHTVEVAAGKAESCKVYIEFLFDGDIEWALGLSLQYQGIKRLELDQNKLLIPSRTSYWLHCSWYLPTSDKLISWSQVLPLFFLSFPFTDIFICSADTIQETLRCFSWNAKMATQFALGPRVTYSFDVFLCLSFMHGPLNSLKGCFVLCT